MRFEIGTSNYRERIIFTAEVARESWILSKASLRYELKVHAPEREGNST